MCSLFTPLPSSVPTTALAFPKYQEVPCTQHRGLHLHCRAAQGADCGLSSHPELTWNFLARVQITRERWCWGHPQPSAHPGFCTVWAEMLAVSTRARSWRWLQCAQKSCSHMSGSWQRSCFHCFFGPGKRLLLKLQVRGVVEGMRLHRSVKRATSPRSFPLVHHWSWLHISTLSVLQVKHEVIPLKSTSLRNAALSIWRLFSAEKVARGVVLSGWADTLVLYRWEQGGRWGVGRQHDGAAGRTWWAQGHLAVG